MVSKMPCKEKGVFCKNALHKLQFQYDADIQHFIQFFSSAYQHTAAASCLSSSLLPYFSVVCLSFYTRRRQLLSKVLVYYYFLEFCCICSILAVSITITLQTNQKCHNNSLFLFLKQKATSTVCENHKHGSMCNQDYKPQTSLCMSWDQVGCKTCD